MHGNNALVVCFVVISFSEKVLYHVKKELLTT